MTTAETMAQWPYPGARWWKFDFHTHTPASHDTPWHTQDLELSPQAWLLKYMAADIDCVAVTDHNSGAWIELLKSAYESMEQLAIEGQPPEGFRALTIFPGVEVSVHGGVHVLALFDPSRSISDIDTLLGQVNYRGTKGGHLRNYLQRKHERPEFADHIRAWFPEDDLRIEYRRDDAWHPISKGSQGQRSAALLAFLLAFGEEPIVLDQPEDDLDNHLIYDLIVRQIPENKLRRQLIIVTHNANVVVNGDAELVHVMEFGRGQCFVEQCGALQEASVRREVCRVMEGGHEAFALRWKRLGRDA